ncbi:DNA repair protein RecO (recombination protein O) [Desulfomicrobium macestii]|uniref:DNA repair protein RecO n=2 Tax=Desulfomicrobium TaxID=898 RepID=A0A8G2F8A7_DESNO|nr:MULTISPECIES: DNA repair protein RecO [Desulfomicrobium]MBE1424948.1 DNA repair protein RecO (recombination protein O) [Desulfomicrobium macestii]SFL82897.1 DNA replication and repair protein RecO [Desulfomicrobium norvegicum]
MEFSEKVLVLRVGTFREADCWVRFFSPTHGLLTAFAFGGRRSRKRFCGCLDQLSLVHFRVSQGRQEYLCLQEGTLINGFGELKRDLKKLGMVSNCVRFFESLPFSPDGYAPAHELLLETLEALDEERPGSWFIPLMFRAKMAFSQGYQPDLQRCRQCGGPLDAHHRAVFAVQEGGLYCLRCPSGGGAKISTSRETLSLLHGLARSGPREWADWVPSAKVREECVRLVDAFVQCHLGLTCEGNRFVRS